MAKRSRKKTRSSPEDQTPAPLAAATRKTFSWLLWPLSLALIAFLVYAPSLRSGFISDARLEINEGFVTSLSNLPKVITMEVLGMHLLLSDRPGEMLYLMFNAALWGKHAFGYHLNSILLHSANVALLWILLRRLIRSETKLAAKDQAGTHLLLTLAVLIFALHPVATESVAEISYSSSLLVTFFVLLGLLATTSFRVDDAKRGILFGCAATLCAIAAVVTKESGIAVALLLIVYWLLFRRGEAGRPWFFFLAAPLFATAVIVFAILHIAVSLQLKLEYLGGSFGQVFLVQPQIWVFMLGQILWPTNLSGDYPLADMNLLPIPVALAILAVFVALQLWLARHSHIGALGVAMWWIGLATVSNFVPIFEILADRFYYLPMAGAAIQLAAVLLLLPWSRIGYGMATGIFAVIALCLALLTLQRETVFATDASFWADTLQKSPHSSLAHSNQGLLLFQQGRAADARQEFEQALFVDPKESTAAVCIALIDISQGQLDDAISQCQRALAINPRNDDAYCALGIALCDQGKLSEGIALFQQALAIDPDDASTRMNLGMALAQIGQLDAAIEQLRYATRIAPNLAKAHYGLGNALARHGQPDQALEEFQVVLQLKPDDVEAIVNLGVIHLHQGHFDVAAQEFQRALKLRPDSAEIHDNLGVALIQKGKVTDAIAQFQEALRLKPGFDSAQINLKKAQAAATRSP